jgi:hypothetical protein
MDPSAGYSAPFNLIRSMDNENVLRPCCICGLLHNLPFDGAFVFINLGYFFALYSVFTQSSNVKRVRKLDVILNAEILPAVKIQNQMLQLSKQIVQTQHLLPVIEKILTPTVTKILKITVRWRQRKYKLSHKLVNCQWSLNPCTGINSNVYVYIIRSNTHTYTDPRVALITAFVNRL